MYYLRARYMNPSTGRFATMDSYEGNSSDPQSLHKYLYANAGPVNRIDPTGHMSTEAIIAVAVVAVLAVAVGSYLLYVYTRKPLTPIVVFDWQIQKWSVGREPLDSSEVDEIKATAIETFKGAFSGFGIVVSAGGGTNRITVKGELGGSVGSTDTSIIDTYASTVYYENIANFAQRYAKELGKTDRREIIRGVGRGIGAAAAHEFGHQKRFTTDNTIDVNSYDYYSGERWQEYYGELHWTPQALEVMKKKLPN